MSCLTEIQQTVRPKPAPRAMHPCSMEQHNTTGARQQREILIDTLPPSEHLLVTRAQCATRALSSSPTHTTYSTPHNMISMLRRIWMASSNKTGVAVVSAQSLESITNPSF
ncbi:hypothetical protein DPMN_185383 [Dreissena polymorpha]|uniref:Uncharacterized protein n=1 Tax=Dreissena polymorpha TaxID=45954 RepID=A0A9D4I8B4_DREPO|nr:hypothetical protein DPMN_185383 [Dreissena polymorpha]